MNKKHSVMSYDQCMELVNQTIAKVFADVQSTTNFEIVAVYKPKVLFEHFQKNLQDMRQNYIRGEPDSFLVASCLTSALLKQKIATFDITNDTPPEVLFINYRIAFEVALKIAAEPITYSLNENTHKWEPTYHPKVNLKVPVGIIGGENLFNRIIKTLANEEFHGNALQIMQFSHFLHTLYLLNSN